MSYREGTLRREEHNYTENSFSLWLFVRHWDEADPRWHCIYSTVPNNIGAVLPPEYDISSITNYAGSIPGSPAYLNGVR